MKNETKRQKVVLTFSQAITTPIYDAIVEEFSEMEIDLYCAYFGCETSPLQIFANSILVETVKYPVSTKFELVRSFVKFMILCRKVSPTAVIGFGQTATILGLSGAITTTKAKRVYFRQHTSSNKIRRFSKGHFYDLFSNFLAQNIIVSNKNTYSYLVREENVNAQKLVICEFGFPIDYFTSNCAERVLELKHKYRIASELFVVGIVSRITPIKGVIFTITAFSQFLQSNPNSVLVIANAMGAKPKDINALIATIPEKNIRVLDRETDMAAVYGSMDVLIHVPISSEVESYGLVYVESFLSGLPTIITLSGIAHEIAEDGKNCLIVDYQDSDGIYNALVKLHGDESLRLILGRNSRQTVLHLNLEKMREKYRAFLLGILESSQS